MTADQAYDAIIDIVCDIRIDSHREQPNETVEQSADRILATLRSLGWIPFQWHAAGDVALGHSHTGYPVFSRNEQWVAFVQEPPAT